MGKILAMILSSDAQNNKCGVTCHNSSTPVERQEAETGEPLWPGGHLMIYIVEKQETEPHIRWEARTHIKGCS